jgi:glycosyltransferase involved in cell wall biosynthesis
MNSSDNRIKIAYVVKMFPRLSETFILNEMLELERQGADITIFSLKKPNEGKFHSQLSNLKAPVFYLEDFDTKKWASWLGEVWPGLSPLKDNLWDLMDRALAETDSLGMDYVLWSAWIAARINQLGIAHVHAHFASVPSTLAYFAAGIASVPFSFTAHAKDIYVYDMQEHYLEEKLLKAKFVVTVTEYNRNYLLENNPALEPDKIRVIYNGVALDNAKSEGEAERESGLILGAGRLVPKKGFDTLLEACRLLKQRNLKFRCLIAGDGSDAELLSAKQRELDLAGEVEFSGPKTQDEILSLMRRATLLCLPCRIAGDGNRDALPTVILEALAQGLPVISTNISGIPEIIDSGTDGILVDPDNPAALADEIGRLLTSPDLRRRFSESGRLKAKNLFDISKNVAKLKKLLLADANKEIPSTTGVISPAGDAHERE